MAKIETLVDDINELFRSGVQCDPERTRLFGEQLANTVADRLSSITVDRPATLRMSNLGRPDRQLWYNLHAEEGKQEEFPAHTLIKFLYGDLLEELLLFLAEEAGHKVERRQEEVKLDGIVGHIDAVIDGVVVDVKSASTYSFQKFQSGGLREDDPFGYMEQLSGYSVALGGLDAGFLAIDKTLGHITFMPVEASEAASFDIPGRVSHIKEVIKSDEPPERCYEPVPEGKSGNMRLDTGCSYCSHKFECWKDANDGIGLRTFLYSSGPKHFTNIEKEPNGPIEVTF